LANAYLKDLAERLIEAGSNCPTMWFPIGRSGAVLIDRLLSRHPELSVGTFINRVNFDRKSMGTSFADRVADDVKGKRAVGAEPMDLAGERSHLMAKRLIRHL
jgi:hypothetical protein